MTYPSPTPDSNPTTAFNFSNIRGVILDMDGVIWRGAEILAGMNAFFDFLRARGIPFVLATNNSTKTAANYVERLAGLGVPVRETHVLTSGGVAAAYMQGKYPPGTPIYVVGGDGIKTLLANAGYVIDPDRAQVVIGGLDTQLTYDKIKIAGRRVLAGAEFLGTNADLSYPVADGFDPGAGTVLAAIGAFGKQTARTFGKPERAMFDQALRLLGTLPEETLMIGDRLDTDILGAKRAGIWAVHVLTGVSSEADFSEIPPDAVYSGLITLREAWEAASSIDPFMVIYQQHADLYQQLVAREDVDGNLLKTIAEITSLEGARVVEFGAGTGRLTQLLAPHVAEIHAYDSSSAMLEVAARLINAPHVHFGVADNRNIALESHSADLTIEGWSFGHWTGWKPDAWQTEIARCIAEMERVTRPGGALILIETLGTGSTDGQAPNDQLAAFYSWLEHDHGFTRRSFRTDYRFADPDEATRLITFFFGADLAARVAGQVDLPEVTGLWFRLAR